LLERQNSEFLDRHVKSSRPGELINQDRIYWGTLKGVGKIYVEVALDVSAAIRKTNTIPFRRSSAVFCPSKPPCPPVWWFCGWFGWFAA
jgi:hypothetical protein